MTTPLPLAGIRVIDLSNAGPGPRCSRILADLGARVVRITPPRAREIEMPSHSYSAGRGWLKLGLDLKSERGRDLLLRLARTADVFIEGFRPGVVARLKIAHEDLMKINEKLIYCSLSGYGQTGSAAARVGHDINYAATAGMFATGDRRSDGAPALPGLTVADAAGGGSHAAIAILAAILRRAKSGMGAFLDISVTDGVLQMMSLFVDEYLATGQEPARGTSVLAGRFACYDFYRTRDDHWLAVGAIESAFFAKLCTALGCEDLIPHQFDDSRQNALRETLKAAFLTRDRADWLQRLGCLDTCVAPVNTIAEVATDSDLASRGLFRDIEIPTLGSVRQVGNIFGRLFGAADLPPAESDCSHILAELGIDAGEVESLRGMGLIS
jgi:alpha-methylacyl-CoA racemase